MSFKQSRVFIAILTLIILALPLLSACGGDTVTPTIVATPTTPATATTAPAAPTTAPTDTTAAPTSTTAAPADTAAPATATAAPTDTAPATPVPASLTAVATVPPTATSDGSAGLPGYVDDRSTPQSTILSYYNAIDRHEYLRAYSYWASGAANLAPFSQFEAGFANTQAVTATLGTTGIGRGAGQIYGSVPVVVNATNTDGSTQTFVGCYTTHLGSPDIQAQPPFMPTAIEKASVNAVPAGGNVTDLLGNACDMSGVAPDGFATPVAPRGPNDVSASLYIDNRSNAVAVLQSYYNAINSQQYARAYSYWDQNGSSSPLQPFPQFQEGFSNTQSVQLMTGQVTSSAGAGNLYYTVPAVVVSSGKDGNAETFAGCYVLHLGQPSVQATPPFQPLAIVSANLAPVAPGVMGPDVMPKSCPDVM